MKLNWKDDRELFDLVIGWRLEGATGGQIAKMLTEKFGEKITRNSVMGFLHRNFKGGGMTFKREKKAKEPPPLVKTIITLPKLTLVEPVVEVIEEDDEDRYQPVVDLNFFSCRWPIGDPLESDFHFCGKPKGPRGSYCPEHHALAYRPAVPRRMNEEARDEHVKKLQQIRIEARDRKRA